MTVATILPEPRTVFLDVNNNPLSGGSVYTYLPNTTTPKTTWQDAAGATPNSNPIILDGQGSCLLYGSGQYTLSVFDASSNLIYTGLSQDVYGLIVNGNNTWTGINTFSGTATAVTQALNNSSTLLATTAFANPGGSVTSPGYAELPSGLIVQWGKNTVVAGTTATVSLTHTFTNNTFTAYATTIPSGGTATQYASAILSGTTQVLLTINTGTATVQWFAVGS